MKEASFSRREILALSSAALAGLALGGCASSSSRSAQNNSFPSRNFPTRSVGKNGPVVTSLAYGTMGLTGYYGAMAPREARRLLDHVYDLGLNYIDTADVYGNGACERLIADFLPGRRERIFLTTKGGFSGSDGHQVLSNDPAYLKKACEDSLRRLKTDHVDMYVLHEIDPKASIEETMEALTSLVKEGKARRIGISSPESEETIRKAHAIHPLSAIYGEYSLLRRRHEKNFIPLCAELGTTYFAFSPLRKGLLAGAGHPAASYKKDDKRSKLAPWQPGNFEENQKKIEPFLEFAKRKQAKPAQVALAWILARHENVIPLFGATTIATLDEDFGALNVHLSPAETEEIDKMFA